MHVLLIVELDASLQQRSALDARLHSFGWTRYSHLTSAWYARIDDSDVLATARGHVARAAAEAGIREYEAICHVGNSAPYPFP